MTHTYYITGLTCNGCVAKAKNELLKMGDIIQADVQLAAPQATISMSKPIVLATLQQALSKAGNYTITQADGGMHHTTGAVGEESKSWFETYKPILLIFFYVTIISIFTASNTSGFNWMMAMQVFMSGFFLTFSFFKLLDLKGFADSYSIYDVIARKWKGWGFIYPFIELLLGIAYAIHFQPLLTYSITFLVMSISIINVLQSIVNKRNIKCACLGAVFNLPMSTITLMEDGLMIAMSAVMLIGLI